MNAELSGKETERRSAAENRRCKVWNRIVVGATAPFSEYVA